MTAELEKCICGGDAAHITRTHGMPKTRGHDKWHAVRCLSCGLTLGESDRRFRAPEEAGKAWNQIMGKERGAA